MRRILREKLTCKRPDNRSSRLSKTKSGDAASGVDGHRGCAATAGIKSLTGTVLGRRTHCHTTADERETKQEPPVALAGRGSDRGGCGFKCET